jgi:hypothetical protein
MDKAINGFQDDFALATIREAASTTKSRSGWRRIA